MKKLAILGLAVGGCALAIGLQGQGGSESKVLPDDPCKVEGKTAMFDHGAGSVPRYYPLVCASKEHVLTGNGTYSYSHPKYGTWLTWVIDEKAQAENKRITDAVNAQNP